MRFFSFHKNNFIDFLQKNLITSSYILAQYLKQKGFKKRAYVIGNTGIESELREAEIDFFGLGPDNMEHPLVTYVKQHFELEDDVGAVIVGFDENFSFPKIAK